MFNQFPRPTPPSPQGGTPGRFGMSQRGSVRPSFLPSPTPSTPAQPTSFSQMNPASQRATLFDQARSQVSQQARFTDPRTNLTAQLPGGLTQKQRLDFESLRRTDPLAAQKQLDTYQRTADIRHNKPAPGIQPLAGPTHRQPPTNFNGPRPRFGA